MFSLATWVTLFQRAVMQGVPILFGATGEILTEKSGNLNLGIPGIMYVGGISGVIGSFLYEQHVTELNPFLAVLIPLICTLFGSLLMGLLYCFLTVTLRANQNVTGLALTIFGTGVGQFVGELMRLKVGGNVTVSNALKDAFANPVLPKFLQDIPVVGPILFSYNFFVYLGFAAAIIMAYVMAKTRCGLSLCAVGESPATADAAGINVTKYRYLATVIGGGISAVGGMVYTMTIAGGVWNHTGLSGEGWVAVALVIFCLWKPLNALWGSILFGGLLIFYLRLPLPFLPTQIYKVLPYIVTAIVLIVVSMRQHKEDQPPQGLGLNYFREER